MSLMDKFRKASKSVVDAGAKTMLKTDVIFLEREIKMRKQSFGIEIYDLMEELESSDKLTTEEKEAKIRSAFDQARKDIAVVHAKMECKKEEMAVLETDAAGASNIPPSSGAVLNNSHPQDAELEQM